MENEYLETAVITRDNIPDLAKRTGRSEEDLLRAYLEAKARNKEVLILLTRLDIHQRWGDHGTSS